MSEQNEPEVEIEPQPEAEPEAEEGFLHHLMDEVKEGFEFIEDKVEDLVDKVKGQDD